MERKNNQWVNQQGGYGISGVFRPAAMILVLFISSALSVKAQNAYNPYAAEEAYYREFNRQTRPLYNGARAVDRAANRIVNYGSRLVRGGRYVRNGYNAARNNVQRHVRLPRRYQY